MVGFPVGKEHLVSTLRNAPKATGDSRASRTPIVQSTRLKLPIEFFCWFFLLVSLQTSKRALELKVRITAARQRFVPAAQRRTTASGSLLFIKEREKRRGIVNRCLLLKLCSNLGMKVVTMQERPTMSWTKTTRITSTGESALCSCNSAFKKIPP